MKQIYLGQPVKESNGNFTAAIFLLIGILVVGFLYIIFLYMQSSERKYITIKTPKDWDKNNPNDCMKTGPGKTCIDNIMFIEDKNDYEAADDQQQEYNKTDNKKGTYKMYYLKNNTPDMKRYIENNWSKPSRYPHVKVIFKRKGNRWDPV
jgi:hypothetical protein